MKEIDRLAQIHADDPEPHRVGQCQGCQAYAVLVDGKMPPHPHRDTSDPCPGRDVVENSAEDYTVTSDLIFGAYYGGAWEQGKR